MDRYIELLTLNLPVLLIGLSVTAGVAGDLMHREVVEHPSRAVRTTATAATSAAAAVVYLLAVAVGVALLTAA